MAQVKSVQYFQFDEEGDIFVFPPRSGISGKPCLVQPGDPLIFDEESVTEAQGSELLDMSASISPNVCDGINDKAIISNDPSSLGMNIVLNVRYLLDCGF